MSSSFTNPGDPTVDPKESQFSKAEKGKYIVTGIADIFSCDASGIPVFKPVQNNLKAMAHFVRQDGSPEQPAWSGTAEDFYDLAKAFGADVTDLQPANTSAFLVEILKRAASGSPLEVYVNGEGWVGPIAVLLPKEGIYRLGFVGGRSVDGSQPLEFKERTRTFTRDNTTNTVTRSELTLIFEILSAVDGNTRYAGQRIFLLLENPFDGVGENEDGPVPQFRVGKNGGQLVATTRLLKFIEIFWPEGLEGYHWASDPEKSVFGINELENPILVIVEKAKIAKRQAYASISPTSGGFLKTDLLRLMPLSDAPPQPVRQISRPRLMELIGIINEIVSNESMTVAFDAKLGSPFALTKAGKVWCRANIAPLWNKLELGQNRQFESLSEENAARLLSEVKIKFQVSANDF